jgi:hypothetical protein
VGSTYVRNVSVRRYFDQEGKALDDAVAEIVYRKIWEYADAAVDLSRAGGVDAGCSVWDYVLGRVEGDEELRGEYLRGVFLSGVKMLAEICACDLDKLSLRYYWMDDDLPVCPWGIR